MDSVTPVFDNMMSQDLVPAGEFSVYLSNTEGDRSSVIIFGGTDPQYYTGSFVYADVTIPSYWLIEMSNIYVGGKSVHDCTAGTCVVVVDTGTSVIIGPPYEMDNVISAIGPVKSDCSNIDSLPTIGFAIAGTTLNLTSDIYVIKEFANGTTECVLGIQSSWEIAPLFILGDPFLRAYYTVFDRDNDRVGFAKAV